MNAPLFTNARIRLGTEGDVPRFLAIAKARYSDERSAKLDGCVQWVKWSLNSPTALVLVGDTTAGIASVYVRYGFERRARLDMLVTEPGNRSLFEPLQIVRAMVKWSAMMGAEGFFRIDADTGVDFAPFAKRLGGHEVDPVKYPRYDIPLHGGLL